MLQDQFINRLLLIVVFGVVYINTMMKMASCNSVETTPQKHSVLKIIGFINVLLGIICLIMGMFWLMQVEYPEQTIDISYSVNQIVRTSDKYVVWGYPTSEQNLAIIGITNVFSSLALAAYCFFYKKSDRKWYKKVGRFFYCLLMYAFYCSATNFHYFDAAELVAPGLFCLMAGHALIKAKRLNNQRIQFADQQRITAIHKMMDERFETETNIGTEEDTRFMPQNEDFNMNGSDKESKGPLTNDVSARTSLPHTEQNKKEETPSMDVVKYCRHCGKKVDYDSSTYCKYCGKEL